MPDILGYWDRRADDPDYLGDDGLGRPMFRDRIREFKEQREKYQKYIDTILELQEIFPRYKRTLSNIAEKLKDEDKRLGKLIKRKEKKK